MKPAKLSYFEKMAPYNYLSNLYTGLQVVPSDQDYGHSAMSYHFSHSISQFWALSYLEPVRHHF